MAGIEQPLNIIEIVKAVGPYAVALGTTAFGYLQTKRVAEITREKDIEITIDKIGNLYEIHFLKNKIVFVSKIKFPENASWISNETTNTFNESIPIFK